MDSSLGFDQIIAILICLILAYIVLREFFCWYYKINERIKNQKETNDLLREIRDALKK